jgi:hypothetical protein
MPQNGNASLTGAITAMSALAGRVPRNEADLLAGLKGIYQALLLADFSTFNVAEVRAAAPRLLQQTFETRLQLRNQIPAWAALGLMTHPVQAVLRDLFRASRYAGEMLGELQLGHPRLAGETVHAAFAGPPGYTTVNPAFAGAPLAFQPGDVILERGRMHNSAAIARIGDVDSQFSHVGVIATGLDGRLVVVEALIEEGSIVNPIDKALAHGLGRAVLFRHRDPALAAAAAELIHDYVLRSDRAETGRIPYDFSMELDIYRSLFCAKLVRMAYAMASSGDYLMPRYPTLLNMHNRDFVDRIGVTATQTFAPGDMELETEFDIIAEWRDVRVTSELRLKDMIMTKLFQWMETEGYRFEPSLNIDMIALLGRLSTHLPSGVQDLVASVVAKVPDNMSYESIGAVAMLHKTAEPLYLELAQLETETIASTGRQLHPRQVFDLLEQIRARDPATVGYLVK